MFCPKCGSQIADGAQFCTNCGQPTGAQQQPAAPPPQSYGAPPANYYNPSAAQSAGPVAGEQKSWLVAVLLSFFLGCFGIDRFYTGHTVLGILKLVTGGGCGIWWLIDFVLYALNSVKDSDGMPLKK